MYALRTPAKLQRPALRLASADRPARTARPAMTLEALPVDSCRIGVSIELAIDHMSNNGMAALSRQPLTPGQLLSLAFPDSPFLPRPGTMARVEDCTQTTAGYQLSLSFNPPPAA